MKPDYSTLDPKGWCGNPRYGAALGRSTRAGDKGYEGRIWVSTVQINSGGYDRLGTYFGTGARLYWYANEDSSIDGMLRAVDRKAAMAQVKALYPAARVW